MLFKESVPSHSATLMKQQWLCAGVQSETCLHAWLRRTKWQSSIPESLTQSFKLQVIKVLEPKRLTGLTMKLSLLQDLTRLLKESLQFGIWKILTSLWLRERWAKALVFPIYLMIENTTCYLMWEEETLASSIGNLIALLHEWWLLSTHTWVAVPPKLSVGCLSGV